ncbi:MAG: 16S rRNA (uracil(1498)-N(3))-methyltransferase [Chitinophagaceae bacterium]|nr:MAG: 16S rRNA (uracil(1498)-N(3))-methyltransferase [Chitinophagaceae bacterium]
MQLPFFYIADYTTGSALIDLDEDTSKHIIQVLRKKKDDQLNLTDGQGNLLTVSIIDDHRKHARVKVDSHEFSEAKKGGSTIAISLVKNSSRFEWFLEKATEIGVKTIVPLLCERTEKEKFRADRLKQILVSAMLQSRQTWLPVLHEPIAYELLFRQEEMAAIPSRYIAHCTDEYKEELVAVAGAHERIILIGPEGDFTQDEIELAIANGYKPVSLGDTRLRTETAGMVAAVILR